MIFFFVKII